MSRYLRNSTWCLLAALLLTTRTWGSDTPPNIVLMVVDDAALMDFGAFGGEAKTPTIDALAERGVVFTQHHATPFCAPSRAMLLTGMDNHLAGLGTIREVLPPAHRGQPGYTMALEPGVETIASKLKRAGYRTYMTGKWHLGHDPGQLPVHHGFDRSFVLDASGADHWEDKPYLPYYERAPWFEDDRPATLPADFYSSNFIAGQMLEYLQADSDNPAPFFAYLAFLAVHIPVQAPQEYTENYLQTYRAGWEAIRQQRWRRAQTLGLIPPGAAPSTQPESIPRWDDLTPEAQRLAAKSMAVNAGALEAMDAQFARLVAWLEQQGQLSNTVFVITSDNGPEAGDPWGSAIQWWLDLQGYTRELANLGERGSYVALGPGGASAAAGPSHLFKFHAAEGGVRVPLIMSGAGLPQGLRSHAFTTMADIAPTIMALAGVNIGDNSAGHDNTNKHNNEDSDPSIKPFTGKSLTPLLRGEAESVYGADDIFAFTTSGQAALYRDGYKLVRNMPPHGDSTWRLFDLRRDPGETRDLSQALPELQRELLHEYRRYANRVGVLELPEGYEVERQIGLNALGKLWQYHWHWFLLAAGALLGLLGLVLWLLRFILLQRRPRLTTNWENG